MDKVSVSYLFSLSRYQTKPVIKFLVGQLITMINFKIYLLSPSKAIADRGERGEDGNAKIWIS